MVHKHHSKQHRKSGDNTAISPPTSPFVGRRPTNAENKFQSVCHEFIPPMDNKHGGKCSKDMYKHSLECRKVCFTSHDRDTGHVDLGVAFSNPLSSSAHVVRESIEGSYYPKRHQHHRKNDCRINLRRVIVGKVRVHFSKNMDTNIPDHHFRISKGGLRIQTTVTRKPSTVVAFIQFIWKKIS
jgi:hypothetical protein